MLHVCTSVGNNRCMWTVLDLLQLMDEEIIASGTGILLLCTSVEMCVCVCFAIHKIMLSQYTN